jgi:hypothetical protein
MLNVAYTLAEAAGRRSVQLHVLSLQNSLPLNGAFAQEDSFSANCTGRRQGNRGVQPLSKTSELQVSEMGPVRFPPSVARTLPGVIRSIFPAVADGCFGEVTKILHGEGAVTGRFYMVLPSPGFDIARGRKRRIDLEV